LKLLFKIVFFITLVTLPVFAGVEVPEFSFLGTDLSSFEMRPQFSDVEVNFKIKSSVDTYIEKSKVEIKKAEEKKFTSDDPGNMYSSDFGTSLAAGFIGVEAYRNAMVKSFLEKDYYRILRIYDKRKEKLETSPFINEANLLYGLALLETSDPVKGIEILTKFTKEKMPYSDIATDIITKYYLQKRQYVEIIKFSSALPVNTPYSMYAYMFGLLKNSEYKKMAEAVKGNEALMAKNKDIYDLAIMAYYFLGQKLDVAKYADNAGQLSLPFVADTFLSLEKVKRSQEYISKIKDEKNAFILKVKLEILKGNLDKASDMLSSLKDDDERLNILFYYVSRVKTDLKPELLNKFKFNSAINRDYINFYNGLYLLAKKQNLEAIRFLDKIIFIKELTKMAYFYRGVAYSTLDKARSEFLFIKYMNAGEDMQKVELARYMIGQFRFADKKYDEALMLSEGCDKYFCETLKAQVYMARKDFKKALSILKGTKGSQAAIIRAGIYYNTKKYKQVISELNKAGQKTRDTEYLAMSTYFKLKDTKSALAVFKKHKKDPEFLSAALDNMFLAGDYDNVLKFISQLEEPDKSVLLIKAKTLSSLKKYDDALGIFDKLIDNGFNLYESGIGALSIYAVKGDEKAFAKEADFIIEGHGRFKDKDLLMLRTAQLLLDMKKYLIATKYLNQLFEEFPESGHLNEAYLLKGRLFKATGRIKQCVQEAGRLATKKEFAEEALLLKAECLEIESPENSLSVYKDLAKENKGYEDIYASKTILLSKSYKKVYDAAVYYKEKDKAQYFSGINRFIELLPLNKFKDNRDKLDEIEKDGYDEVLPTLYYYSAKSLAEAGKNKGAVQMFMKLYYIYPTHRLTKYALNRAHAIYRKTRNKKGMSVVSEKIRMLKKLKKRNKKK